MAERSTSSGRTGSRKRGGSDIGSALTFSAVSTRRPHFLLCLCASHSRISIIYEAVLGEIAARKLRCQAGAK